MLALTVKEESSDVDPDDPESVPEPFHDRLRGMLLLKRSKIPLSKYPMVLNSSESVEYSKVRHAMLKSHQEIKSLSGNQGKSTSSESRFSGRKPAAHRGYRQHGYAVEDQLYEDPDDA